MDLRTALITWFDTHARTLPFRGTGDPYAVWVSEVMLQQTRVDTVLRYYDRFMQRFPTPAALASADEDEVLSLWSGLGYYRRARLLHQGVREVVESYGGRIPKDAHIRRQLPGIGRYTAGAIGSIAFDQAEPLVDGNVARVFARLFSIDSPLSETRTQKWLWQRASELVQGPRPGTWNQALMELGATVCHKARPACDACPVQTFCMAFKTNRTTELPITLRKKPPVPTPLVALLATSRRGQQVWLARGEQTLFGGLWNLPMTEGTGPSAGKNVLERLGLSGQMPDAPVASFVHVLSHRRLEVTLFQLAARGKPSHALRAVTPAELSTLGVSALTKKALRHGNFCT